MAQKVLKIGSSIGITIPKHIAEEFKLVAGDSVTLAPDQKSGGFKVIPKNKATKSQDKIAKLTLNFIKRYRSDLEALKDK